MFKNKKLILALLLGCMAVNQPVQAGFWDSVSSFFGNKWGKVVAVAGVMYFGYWLFKKPRAKKILTKKERKQVLGKSLFGKRPLTDYELKIIENPQEALDDGYFKGVYSTAEDFKKIRNILLDPKEVHARQIVPYLKSIKKDKNAKINYNFLKNMLIARNRPEYLRQVLGDLLDKTDEKQDEALELYIEKAKQWKSKDVFNFLVRYRQIIHTLRGKHKKTKRYLALNSRQQIALLGS